MDNVILTVGRYTGLDSLVTGKLAKTTAQFDKMSTETGNDCQSKQSTNLFPNITESELRLPLDTSMRFLFTGLFNGFGVEIHSAEEMALLYHMGCFGKGSASRAKPRSVSSPSIMRKRQFLKRTFWHKKFGGSSDTGQADEFLQDVDELTANIIAESKSNRDVIDLVSSDDDTEVMETADDVACNDMNAHIIHSADDDDMVVIVPNSDSEGENYFENFKPKCCINKIKLHEKLMLTLQEAFFLMYGLGCLQVYGNDRKLLNTNDCWRLFNETDPNFVTKYVVYHYFRAKGYVVKPGIKFGVLYKEGPAVAHADYIVVIREPEDKSLNNWISILGHVRMAATTVKEILIAEVSKSNEESKESYKTHLKSYKVREILLTRNLPVTINNEID